jgi:hypothetical protein
MTQEIPAELIKQLVDMANANDALMDGTMAPVKKIINENEVVFAVWQDWSQPHSVDLLLVKGQQRLNEIVANNKSAEVRIAAVKCIEEAQAMALIEVLGEKERRHDQ